MNIAGILKEFKCKKLITLNKFIYRKGVVNLSTAKDYATELSKSIQRTDFIPYDSDGNLIVGHKPLFKGWTVCEHASSDTKKVASLQTQGNSYKIYFDTAQGATIISLEHMTDNCTYNDLAIFFEGNLELV